jgi:DNA repair exonuclease SbcCD ATPase subunit
MPKPSQIDEELRDLKQRFELLNGDRKAYYESSQMTIRKNKEEIAHLAAQNKELRSSITKLIKVEEEVTPKTSMNMTAFEKFDHEVINTQKRCDRLKCELERKEKQLYELEDNYLDLKKVSEGIKNKNNPKLKEISSLENRLDKALIKYNEAQSIKKMYEQIIKKLQEEQLTFDQQLAYYEKTLKIKKQDIIELESMSRDANHAKEIAKSELIKFEQKVNEERKHREKELETKKEMVKQKLEFHEKNDRKVKQMEDMRNDIQVVQDQGNKEHFDEAKEKKLAEYEETMRLIKEATGVSDVNDVINKFQFQGETHTHLKSLEEQNRAKIQELKEHRAAIMAEYDELKYSGESRHAASQRIIDEFQEHLKEAEDKCDEAKTKYEWVFNLLSNAKAGIQHLYEKLEGIKLIPEGESKETEGEDRTDTAIKKEEKKEELLIVTDDNIADVLNICNKKLQILYESVKEKQKAILESAQITSVQQNQQQQSIEPPANIITITQAGLPPFNTRVKLRAASFEEDNGDDNDDDNDDVGGEVLDRETIKKQFSQLVNTKIKQNKKSKKKRKDDDD